ncbi:L-lactate dehydrogenase complex protein LldG [Ferrimonas sediminum]|uniref:L-lactate dehydrogenase complex protein LldG n=1 Tax=Ferrimonas sediminum TaxID=718193 RepID=A0A1G8LWS7_9GAMM|nr:LUD domain-containing protein [Ferrimonas sediminum]SDI60083.1 L-lactate dehydrogenase complex protein LldG [Ferrimonas sediminum]
MSSRDAIFAALDTCSLPDAPMPTITVEPNNTDLIGQYEANLAKVGGTLVQVSSLEEVQAQLNAAMADNQQVISRVEGLTGNRELDAKPHDLHNVDLAIVDAELAVAENGAVFVRETASGHRVLPYITENLAVVVKRDTTVANMHEAIKVVKLESGQHGAFIAGPSKTADIEQALVIGAHGACSMTVYMIG